MTTEQAYQHTVRKLSAVYSERESAAIAQLVMEKLLGWKKMDRILNKDFVLSPPKAALLDTFCGELLAHKPVQYVLQEAWFCGMPFYVNEQVLIPRPETEELVKWLADDLMKIEAHGHFAMKDPVLLDIGTGSGCMAIAMKKKFPALSVCAIDVSEGALAVARVNARANGVMIQFMQLDFLDPQQWLSSMKCNWVLSNPPYIPEKDKAAMHPNVLDYEPSIALFVSDEDPLLFYKSLASFAQQYLFANGKVYTELHEDFAGEVYALFCRAGFDEVQIRKDMQGKNRMLSAKLNR